MLGPREFDRLIVAALYRSARYIRCGFVRTFLKMSVEDVSYEYRSIRKVERLMDYLLRHPTVEYMTLRNKFPKTVYLVERWFF